MGEKKIEDILEMLANRLSPPSRSDGFLSLEQAASFLGGMPVKSLQDKINNGEIKCYKPGRHVIFDPKELKEYVKRFPKG